MGGTEGGDKRLAGRAPEHRNSCAFLRPPITGICICVYMGQAGQVVRQAGDAGARRQATLASFACRWRQTRSANLPTRPMRTMGDGRWALRCGSATPTSPQAIGGGRSASGRTRSRAGGGGRPGRSTSRCRSQIAREISDLPIRARRALRDACDRDRGFGRRSRCLWRCAHPCPSLRAQRCLRAAAESAALAK